MTTKRGDVVLVQFPRSNLRGFDRRPALVVETDGLGTSLPQRVLAMITSNLSRAGHPSRVLVGFVVADWRRVGIVDRFRYHDGQLGNRTRKGHRFGDRHDTGYDGYRRGAAAYARFVTPPPFPKR